MLNFLNNYILNTPLKMISYAEYIQLALYHPELGYYMKGVTKIGTEGDFITTSNISDIYGRAVAKWFHKESEKHDLPPNVCEIGGGNGRFAKAFIEEWNSCSNEPLHYVILEESPYHRKLQRDEISFSDKIRQIKSLAEISPFNGLIFSNELYDAFPVHVIEKQQDQLMEIMISVENGQLTEINVPLNNDKILSFLEESALVINNGQRIEVPLLMENMVSEIALTMERGIVLTVDYGYTNEEWLEPSRREGSLRGYYKHEQINSVLEHPGEMDITSHVHFDSLIQIGNQNGMKFIQKFRQDEFLLTTGILHDLQDHYDPNPFSEVSKRNRAIRSLIMPSGLSSSFHVILQHKEI